MLQLLLGELPPSLHTILCYEITCQVENVQTLVCQELWTITVSIHDVQTLEPDVHSVRDHPLAAVLRDLTEAISMQVDNPWDIGVFGEVLQPLWISILKSDAQSVQAFPSRLLCMTSQEPL